MSNTESPYIPEPVRFDNGEVFHLAGIAVRHDGHVSGLRALIDRIFRDWLPASGELPSRHPDFCEVYGSDFDPVRLEGRIEVRLPLQSSTT